MSTVQALASINVGFWFITLMINSALWINTRQPLRAERMALLWGIHFVAGAWLCIFSGMYASSGNTWQGRDTPVTIAIEIGILSVLVLMVSCVILLNYLHYRQKKLCT